MSLLDHTYGNDVYIRQLKDSHSNTLGEMYEELFVTGRYRKIKKC